MQQALAAFCPHLRWNDAQAEVKWQSLVQAIPLRLGLAGDVALLLLDVLHCRSQPDDVTLALKVPCWLQEQVPLQHSRQGEVHAWKQMQRSVSGLWHGVRENRWQSAPQTSIGNRHMPTGRHSDVLCKQALSFRDQTGLHLTHSCQGQVHAYEEVQRGYCEAAVYGRHRACACRRSWRQAKAPWICLPEFLQACERPQL